MAVGKSCDLKVATSTRGEGALGGDLSFGSKDDYAARCLGGHALRTMVLKRVHEE